MHSIFIESLLCAKEPYLWKLAYTSKHTIIILHKRLMDSNKGIKEEFKAEVTKLVRKGIFRLSVKKKLLLEPTKHGIFWLRRKCMPQHLKYPNQRQITYQKCYWENSCIPLKGWTGWLLLYLPIPWNFILLKNNWVWFANIYLVCIIVNNRV